jgi:hypothetical protein
LPAVAKKPKKTDDMRNYCNGDCQKVKIKSECLPGGACKSKMELQQKTKNKYMLVGCQNMIMQNNASKPSVFFGFLATAGNSFFIGRDL